MAEDITIAYIAAGSALAGVVLSQFISIGLAVFEKRHKKQALLRQKYEEMMFHFQDSLGYVQAVYNCENFAQLRQLGISPGTNKSVGLASLYFRDLLKPLSRYADAQLSFYNSVITLFNGSVSANAGSQAVVNLTHKQRLNELSDAQKTITDLIIANAYKYTKA